jgi:DNA polymerase-1
MNDKLLIVDGNSILNRAFYAIKGPRMLTRSDGTPTNAVYGFINILHKYIEEEKPDYIGVAFDLKARTFRNDLYKEYKANRKGMPDELLVQLPIIKKVLRAMNIYIAEAEGLEADDVIGIYSKKAEETGLNVSILTGDRDALQLVSDKVTVIIPSTSKGLTSTVRYTPKEVMEKYGLNPVSLIEVKGLMGDSSDNIPGVKGVGEKTAVGLIKQFGTLENLYENLNLITKEKLRNTLEENKEIAFMSRCLATIVREHEGLGDVSNMKRREFNKKELLKVFRELEFNSFINRMGLNECEIARDQDKISEGLCKGNNKEIIDICDCDSLAKEFKDLSMKDKLIILPIIRKAVKIGGELKALYLATDQKKYCILAENFDINSATDALKLILENHGLTLVTCNIKEFYVWVLSMGIDIKCRIYDIMIAEYLIDSLAKTYSIPWLAQKYLNMNVEMLSDNNRDLALNYLDIINSVSEQQSGIIDKNKQQSLYYDIELPLSLVLGSMEYHGFKVDPNTIIKYREQLEESIYTLEKAIYMMAGEEFNINSPKQLGAILFEKLGLKAVKKTKTGYSTSAEALNSLYDKHEIIPLILEYRQLAKLKSTYTDGLIKVINPITKRIHSSFNQTVTATGRISSTEPNLQNIPIRTELGREIRKAFVPEEGFVFVDADYSQIELRVLAHITGDEMLRKAFLEGEDIHTHTASQVFRVPEEFVTAEMRSRAKAVNFGIVYGISDFSLAKDINVSQREASLYIQDYFNTFPKIKEYMDNIVEHAKKKGYVETMFHRQRSIPELKSPNLQVRSFGKRVALNTPIQGTAADIIKIAMVKVWRELKRKGLKSRLILQVHDELLVETAIDEIDEVKDIVKRNMEEAVELSVPLIADVSIGNNWYETK